MSPGPGEAFGPVETASDPGTGVRWEKGAGILPGSPVLSTWRSWGFRSGVEQPCHHLGGDLRRSLGLGLSQAEMGICWKTEEGTWGLAQVGFSTKGSYQSSSSSWGWRGGIGPEPHASQVTATWVRQESPGCPGSQEVPQPPLAQLGVQLAPALG